jgi:transposase
LIPRRAGERIKNDRRDCLRLADLPRAGELKAIWVPDEAHEAMCNLWRAREDAVGMRLKARQQLQAFLLRHGRRYPGKTNWIKSHADGRDGQLSGVPPGNACAVGCELATRR